jgi:predicted RNA-binding protein (virulence factor B family)
MTSLKVGEINELRIVKEVPFGLYLDSSEGEILLPKKYVSEGNQVGEMIKVFIYTDSEDRLIATTLKPLAVLGDFACLTVVHTTSFGSFLEWGLEKQLFVPLKEQHKLMREGEKYIVKLCLDERTNRVIGVGKISSFIEKDEIKLQEGEEVELMVYEITVIGIMCIINNKYAGMLYRNEVFKDLSLGDKLIGYVKKIREDNKIDLSTRKAGYVGIVEDKNIIIQHLEEAKGFLPYNDLTSPEEIQQVFGMSKKSFKKLIGNLYKSGLIRIDNKGIYSVLDK